MNTPLSEIKRKNKEAGQYFFDRGNPRVESQQGDYLVTKSVGEGYAIYKFNSQNGHIDFVDNPSGEYSWQPYEKKSDAVKYAIKLKNK